MSPWQIAKTSEHSQQSALFAWCNMAKNKGFAAAWDEACYKDKDLYPMIGGYSELQWFHAIPNGGALGDDEKTRMIRGAQKKAEGVKKGVADTLLPVKRSVWSGLYVEMKKLKGGRLSPAQEDFRDFVTGQGYGWYHAKGWEDAARTIQAYFES
ncbi:restriction endonuclease [Erwinia phage AH03]|uniref:Restriction endonuclease n=1 Tax=Erwinia phage AH03 TaxID=2869568 RepID=A0AAE7X0A2_9CAUD|nr:restriction endonuclease [Erwinia phage AH03]